MGFARQPGRLHGRTPVNAEREQAIMRGVYEGASLENPKAAKAWLRWILLTKGPAFVGELVRELDTDAEPLAASR